MTDLIALARQAGLYDDDQEPLPKYLQAFAELVRQDEREKLQRHNDNAHAALKNIEENVKAIRARTAT